ncbi:TetR/AcrR family transcriptional regulator [Pseudonocardia eucalypti]|uniref:TetR/AcrR family transcriptional regulator n=1 Tax=Pseudonocardia eucalypti TaxID=648755 RepID=A0ABP9PP69_9PSEU|nr:AcrR family transcriptional regulator [Pseudonocardia eucalypti]
MAATTTRRQRLREATLVEIRQAARALLVADGPEAVTINGVARELGMSGPGIYRYYSGHQDLVDAVTADFFAEIAGVLDEVRAAHGETDRRLLAMCRALRGWAVAHPAEFRWVFTSPVAGGGDRATVRYRAGHRFGDRFLDEVASLWAVRPFPTPAAEDLPESLWTQLRAHADEHHGRLPAPALHVFLTCWIRLYGQLCMEVLHQLDFAFADPEPMYEECLRELSHLLGLTYRPPD